jgi:hypothetical protein
MNRDEADLLGPVLSQGKTLPVVSNSEMYRGCQPSSAYRSRATSLSKANSSPLEADERLRPPRGIVRHLLEGRRTAPSTTIPIAKHRRPPAGSPPKPGQPRFELRTQPPAEVHRGGEPGDTRVAADVLHHFLVVTMSLRLSVTTSTQVSKAADGRHSVIVKGYRTAQPDRGPELDSSVASAVATKRTERSSVMRVFLFIGSLVTEGRRARSRPVQGSGQGYGCTGCSESVRCPR